MLITNFTNGVINKLKRKGVIILYGFGCIPSPPDGNDIKFSEIIKEAAIELNLPVNYEIADLSPVKNQGQEGTCVGFACTVGMKEYQEKKEFKRSVELSPRYLYQKCKEVDGIPDRQGTYIRTAMDVLKNKGVCEWKFWPYIENDIRSPEPDAEKNAPIYKIKSYVRLDGMSAVKQSLILNGPFVMGVPVFNSWFDESVRVNGIIPTPESDRSESGHAICIIGYDDNTRRFKFKNSWGIEWGEQGYGYLPYEYLNSTQTEAWSALDASISDYHKEIIERITRSIMRSIRFRPFRRW